MSRARLPLLLGVVSIVACSKSEEAAPDAGVASAATPARLASCDRVPSMSTCSEYAGAYLAQNEPALAGSCKRLGGTFAYAECPNTAVLGSCTLPTGEVRKLYASGEAAFDAARAKTECDASYHGAWKELR